MAATNVEQLRRAWAEPGALMTTVATVDHKRIGVRYLITATLFFLLAGLEALTMRTQLARPNERLLTPEAYDQLFSMHGITMIFLFVTPMLSGFGNYFVPLMIGARDMAFPRLNALSYWVFLASGIFMYSGLLIGSAPDAGWFSYAPLSSTSPGSNLDFYGLGLIFLGISSTAGAVNFIVTIIRLRAPGMSLNRMPLFCWAILATSFSLVFAVPSLTADCLFLELSRKWGYHFFDAAHGGDALLWQHLFWIFGHPDVYIIFLPAVGIVSTIIPVFSRRPMVAYHLVALATMATAFLGFGVWVHHMFAVGLPQITMTVFAAASLVIAIPSGIQVFAWIATLMRGRPVMRTPFLFVVGFIVTFVIGGLSGVMFAVIPFDQQVTDSYFVVAHFHYVLFGGAVFPILAAIHYWLPKISGRMLDERLGAASFWSIFLGFNLTFFPMHIAGLLGMPRRVYTYPSGMGWDALNLLSTIGSYVLAIGILMVVVNVLWSLVRGRPAGNDPWEANTLEWSTTSPPPNYNFATIPVVRSADPNWDEPERSELLLAHGHETVATSELEGELEGVLRMPEDSVWPLILAVSLAVFFVGLIASSNTAAWIGVGMVVVSLAGWHLPTTSGDERSDPPPAERTGGWWGMVLLIATEATLFAVLLATYFYLRFEPKGVWPPDGLRDPKLLKPLVATLILVASSATIVLSTLAARRGQLVRVRVGLLATVALGVVFLILQRQIIDASLRAFHPGTNAYGSIFYTLLGLHAAHVVLGVLLAAWAVLRTIRFDRSAVVTVRVVSFYVHFVNVVAAVVFLVLYVSPRG